jgi:hypothetical protein
MSISPKRVSEIHYPTKNFCPARVAGDGNKPGLAKNLLLCAQPFESLQPLHPLAIFGKAPL